MNLKDRKQALRQEIRDRILRLDPNRRRAEERALQDRFPDLPVFERAGCVLLYASAFAEEIETGPLLRLTLDRGKRLVCPRVDRASGRLHLHEVAAIETDLRRGTLGIPEPRKTCVLVAPDEVDWVLVPGLGFNEACYRIGRGAGHYDRLLPMLRPEATRWAIALDCQWVDDLPVEPHDVPLDGVSSISRTALRHSR